jgi:hypothetical protein
VPLLHAHADADADADADDYDILDYIEICTASSQTTPI